METIIEFFYRIILKVTFETLSLVVDQTSTISYGTI